MEKNKTKKAAVCPVAKKCGGCEFQGMPYAEQLKHKEKRVRILLDSFGKVHPIIGMKDPYHYRNKVHAVFDRDRRGNAISGVYQKGTHKVVPVDSCMIEDQKADEIIVTIRGLLKSFKIKTYDEDTQYGLLRHVLIRHGFSTGEIMVVLVTASPVFPSKKIQKDPPSGDYDGRSEYQRPGNQHGTWNTRCRSLWKRIYRR